jgi:membrane protease YdiL (CAAX protease family)
MYSLLPGNPPPANILFQASTWGGCVSEKGKVTAELIIVSTLLCIIITLMQYGGLYFASWESVTFIGIPLLVAILLNLPNSELGIIFRHPLSDLKFFGLACLLFLPPFIIAFFLYKLFWFDSQFALRLPAGLGRELAVNFLYFALPEELLFRGYMQKRLGRVLPKTYRLLGFELPLAGVICAAFFALAHVLYEASLVRLLVFFPALVFAWLRHRTDSVLAPVLFHGTCNVVAFVMMEMFTAGSVA